MDDVVYAQRRDACEGARCLGFRFEWGVIYSCAAGEWGAMGRGGGDIVPCAAAVDVSRVGGRVVVMCRVPTSRW